MIDNSIREYIRLIGSISLSHKEREKIVEYLIEKSTDKKEISVKYVAAASAVAFIAVGTYLITRGSKQDINIM